MNVSDGTLRALGVLIALFQGIGLEADCPLVGLEEPELALHPAAASALLDAVQEAAESRQVVVTTHSPDLLDSSLVTADMIRPVIMVQGETRSGPVDDAGRTALAEGLYNPGELLRMNQLAPSAMNADQLRAGAPDI